MKTLILGLVLVSAALALALAANPGTAFAGRATLDTFGAAPPWQPSLHVPVDNYVGFVGHDDDGLDSVTLCTSGSDSSKTASDAGGSGGVFGRDPSAPASLGLGGMAVHNDGPDETNPTAPAGTETPTATAPSIGTPEEARALAQEILRGMGITPADAAAAVEDEARNAGGDGSANGLPATLVNPTDRTPESRGDARVIAERDVDGLEAMHHRTAEMLRMIAQGRRPEAEQVQVRMQQAGHYGVTRQVYEMPAQAATRDGYNTLTDADGGILLPDEVSNEIMTATRTYGVIRRRALQIPVGRGTSTVPNLMGELPAFPIGEGNMLKARKAAFDGIKLEPKLRGTLVPWSKQLSQRVGAVLIPLITQKAGEGFAKLEDQTGLFADGSAAYLGAVGIAGKAGIGKHTLSGTGMGSFVADDVFDMRLQVKSYVRNGAIHIFHPDWKDVVLRKLKQDNRYLYDWDSDGPTQTLGGRDVEWTEALPAYGAAADPDATFSFFANLMYQAFGTYGTVAVQYLDQATIQDVDDATLIHLAAQHMAALKFTYEYDVKTGPADAFAEVATAAA